MRLHRSGSRRAGLSWWNLRRGLLPLLLACLGGAAQAGASLYASHDDWVDDNGHNVQLAQWRGKPTVVAMEYSACRFICSIYWRRLLAIQQEADRRGLELQFVVLSIDPEHDTPANWREYRKERGMQRTNWSFLTSNRAATTRAAALLGVHWWFDEGHLMHDFKVVRLDGQGGIAAAMTSYDEPVDLLLTPAALTVRP